jgi:primase-polymerase (primpol)-like protein
MSIVPSELIDLRQWVIWRYVLKPGENNPTKVLHTAMGYPASPTNPDHWSKFEFAQKAAARPGFCDGIGFVFTVDDPYCGIDLDDIWQSDTDEGAPPRSINRNGAGVYAYQRQE